MERARHRNRVKQILYCYLYRRIQLYRFHTFPDSYSFCFGKHRQIQMDRQQIDIDGQIGIDGQIDRQQIDIEQMDREIDRDGQRDRQTNRYPKRKLDRSCIKKNIDFIPSQTHLVTQLSIYIMNYQTETDIAENTDSNETIRIKFIIYLAIYL